MVAREGVVVGAVRVVVAVLLREKWRGSASYHIYPKPDRVGSGRVVNEGFEIWAYVECIFKKAH